MCVDSIVVYVQGTIRKVHQDVPDVEARIFLTNIHRAPLLPAASNEKGWKCVRNAVISLAQNLKGRMSIIT